MATDYKVGQILAALKRLTLREDQADRLIEVIIERLETLQQPGKKCRWIASD